MDFLSEENVCGQSLLKLVSRGSAILAELQRLSDNIPKIFYGQSAEFKKYEKILFTFEYLLKIDTYEDEIQYNPEILELDTNFKETYLPLIERFYILFESIYLYYSDLMEFMQELSEAVFIQYTVELVLQNFEGKKLFCEAFYLYGCMLLLMDNLIIGPVREKLVIAYYRYKGGQSAITFINQVCKLCKDTGYIPAAFTADKIMRRPQYYPEEYFSRFDINNGIEGQDIISEIVNAIKDDDIYKYMNAFPLAEQRGFALSTQASMLYVLLYFNPKILESKRSRMREIVDKHFSDNWVITYYLGYYVDLSQWWDPYQAANLAIKNTTEIMNIKQNIDFFNSKMLEATATCEDYLIDGQITDEYVLDKVDKLMNCVRDCNITVRWLLLHRQTSIKQAKDMFDKIVNPEQVLHLLLISSKFESVLTKVFQELIATKQTRWDQDKIRCVERMNELSEYFSGKALGKVVPDESYKVWFAEMAKQINNLEFNDSTYAGRKIQHLSNALTDIEQYNQISTSIQVKHYLQETRNDLKHMVRIVGIKTILLTHISFISDISYSWQCLKDFQGMMQQKVQQNPHAALLLKTTFQKLSSILNTPMIRIIQANSPDINSVSKYYSGELIKFVKEVLQIIPIQIFDILHEVITLLTSKLKPIPSKLNKSDLKDYAQFEDRQEMAKLTNSISVFTESILSVESYLLGVIEVNPKELLDQGIRKELLGLIHSILDKALFFTPKNSTVEEFTKRMNKLAESLCAFRQAVEYIQDFINAYGNKMFIEEFDRLMACYIDMEVSCLNTNKLTFEELAYDEDIPMPDEKSLPFGVINFTGRLLKQILSMTDMKNTTYIEATLGFYDLKTGADAFNMKTISLLSRCIGNSGLNGLDKLLAYSIQKELKLISKIIGKEINEEARRQVQQQLQQIKVLTSFNENYEKIYQGLRKQFRGLIQAVLPPLQRIGQMVLLRRLISLHLKMKAKVGSSKLFLSLETLNDALLNDIKNRGYSQQMEQDIENENILLFNANKLFQFVGLQDPLRKIYITEKTPEHLPLIMTLVLMNQLPLLDFDPKLNTLIRRGKQEIPFEPNFMIVGIVATLNQYHQTHTDILVSYLGHYVKSVVNFLILSKDIQKSPDLVGDMFTMLYVIEEVFRYKEDSYENFKQLIPFGLLNNLSKQLLKTASTA